MTKLWGGRFREPFDSDAAAFSFSIDIDQRLYPYDIALNQAHAQALVGAGIISHEEQAQMVAALSKIKFEMDVDITRVIQGDEDIHSCIERLLILEVGDLGKTIHTGKSRNDQVITGLRLFVKDQCDQIIERLKTLCHALVSQAEANLDVIFPGFTHFQTAQPVLLAHHFLAYVHQFNRDIRRFRAVHESADVCPLGAGALAGNNYGLNRELIARELGFSRISQNSMDAVSDRDFVLEFLSAAAMCMSHLSRLSEELVVWSSPLVGFVTIGDAFTTGSSIMPQKKNPDIAELIRGKSGRVLGHLTAMHTTIKALPLTYNRDLQEDKAFVFDSADTVSDSLLCMAKMIPTLTINRSPIAGALEKGYILATEFADYLVKKGVPFRESHEITGHVVLYAEENGKSLPSLTIDEMRQFSSAVTVDVYDALTLQAAVDAKNVVGGTATARVKAQLSQIKEMFGW